jgi:hypothetical protein
LKPPDREHQHGADHVQRHEDAGSDQAVIAHPGVDGVAVAEPLAEGGLEDDVPGDDGEDEDQGEQGEAEDDRGAAIHFA